jgi:hypothetical protein
LVVWALIAVTILWIVGYWVRADSVGAVDLGHVIVPTGEDIVHAKSLTQTYLSLLKPCLEWERIPYILLHLPFFAQNTRYGLTERTATTKMGISWAIGSRSPAL